MPCIGAGVVAAFAYIGGFVGGGALAGLAVTAAVGAAVGGITSAISGGDIMKGMLFGAVGAVAVVGIAGGIAGLGGFGSSITSVTSNNPALLAQEGLGWGGTIGTTESTSAIGFGEAIKAGGGSLLSMGGGEGGGSSALWTAAGKGIDALGSEGKPEQYIQEGYASKERIAKMEAESAAEVARIRAAASGSGGGGGGGGAERNYEWEGEQAELDRMLARDTLTSKEGIAKGERDAVIKKASMEIADSRAARESDIKSAADRRNRAIKGLTSGTISGSEKTSRSTRTPGDIRDEMLKGGAPDPAALAGTVPPPAPAPAPAPNQGVPA